MNNEKRDFLEGDVYKYVVVYTYTWKSSVEENV